MITIEQIGNEFKENRYILTDKGYKQYIMKTGKFAKVEDTIIYDIIKRIYPNFERIPINAGLINPYIPHIKEKEFQIYEYCKKIKDGKIKTISTENRINTAIESNNKTKKKIDFMKSRKFADGIQHLRNNDVFTTGEQLIQYKDNKFNQLNTNDVSALINNRYTLKDTQTLIKQSKIQLTKIDERDIIAFEKYNNLTAKDWTTYDRIKDLIKSYQ